MLDLIASHNCIQLVFVFFKFYQFLFCVLVFLFLVM
jgi:hypothetical protein